MQMRIKNCRDIVAIIFRGATFSRQQTKLSPEETHFTPENIYSFCYHIILPEFHFLGKDVCHIYRIYIRSSLSFRISCLSKKLGHFRYPRLYSDTTSSKTIP